jgi:hypothetical protein
MEAADMHSVHWKYGIPFFSTLHSHGNFSFQVTKVLSVTECFHFVELLSVFTAPFKISSMISVATILLLFTAFSISVSKIHVEKNGIPYLQCT